MPFGDAWTPEQKRLADIVYGVWRDAEPGQWPLFAYVEQQMYVRGLNAGDVLASFPAVGRVGVGSPHYGDVAWDRVVAPRPDTRIRLTVSGLSKVIPDDPGIAGAFIALLQVAGQKRLKAVLDPFMVTDVILDGMEYAAFDKPGLPTIALRLYDMISEEPHAVTGLVQHHPATVERPWSIKIAPWTARFASGITVDDYLKLIAEKLNPAPTQQPRVLPSPLAILDSLHYLNITWERHCRRRLVRVENFALAASLAFDVANGDEFAARLSAFGDLMKNLQSHSVSGVDGPALKQLEAYLRQQLPDETDQASIAAVLPVLRAVTRIRNGLQHSAAASDGMQAWRDLGLDYPPSDWNEAWLQLRAIATDAIMDLRLLVEHLPVDGCGDHPSPGRSG